MTKVKFYSFFIIFNIILAVLTLLCTIEGWILMLFNEFPSKYTQQVSFCGLGLYLATIVVKTLLPKILSNIGQKHKNSLLDKFLLCIKEIPKKQILLFAFIFDILFILYLSYVYENLFLFILSYFILYLGGLFFFYLTLYNELKAYK